MFYLTLRAPEKRQKVGITHFSETIFVNDFGEDFNTPKNAWLAACKRQKRGRPTTAQGRVKPVSVSLDATTVMLLEALVQSRKAKSRSALIVALVRDAAHRDAEAFCRRRAAKENSNELLSDSEAANA